MNDFLKEKTEKLRQRRLEPKPPRRLTRQEQENRAVRGYFSAVLVVCLLVFGAVPAYATSAASGDPLTTINNLSTFIFGAIKAIGIIMLGFGIVQIGLSLKSHDASQRANGLMTFFGGIIIAFSKNILDLILS